MFRMLAMFPNVLFLGLYSALLIRTALALTLAYAAWNHVKGERAGHRILSGVEILTAGALAVGAWTQLAAIIAVCILAIWSAFPSTRTVARGTIALAIVLALSLIVTGPGAYAFDLPL